MPGSVIQGKQQIKSFIDSNRNDIKKIVDVGAGSGTYPNLLGREDYYWIGIEIFPDYVERFDLNSIYDEIIIADISELPKEEWPEADCIIFGDVLEHLPKPKAIEVLDRALMKYKHVVLSIPIGFWDAEEHYGNKHELHLSTWTMAELRERADWTETHHIMKNSIGVFCK